MKFRAKIRIKGTGCWHWETFEENTDDPRQYILDLMEQFNAGLKPEERAREYGGMIRILDRAREHDWEKTNLVTILKRGRMYDAYRCRNCPVTSKRYGIGGHFVRDGKYKGEKYERCDWNG